jgi:hypothetical protein
LIGGLQSNCEITATTVLIKVDQVQPFPTERGCPFYRQAAGLLTDAVIEAYFYKSHLPVPLAADIARTIFEVVFSTSNRYTRGVERAVDHLKLLCLRQDAGGLFNVVFRARPYEAPASQEFFILWPVSAAQGSHVLKGRYIG